VELLLGSRRQRFVRNRFATNVIVRIELNGKTSVLLDTPWSALLKPASDGDYNPAEFQTEAVMAGARKVIDCRQFPAEKPCSIAISGTEEEVITLAVLHAGTVHGHADTLELREQIRAMLQDQSAASEAA
jgi:hypothetical protein